MPYSMRAMAATETARTQKARLSTRRRSSSQTSACTTASVNDAAATIVQAMNSVLSILARTLVVWCGAHCTPLQPALPPEVRLHGMAGHRYTGLQKTRLEAQALADLVSSRVFSSRVLWAFTAAPWSVDIEC